MKLNKGNTDTLIIERGEDDEEARFYSYSAIRYDRKKGDFHLRDKDDYANLVDNMLYKIGDSFYARSKSEMISALSEYLSEEEMFFILHNIKNIIISTSYLDDGTRELIATLINDFLPTTKIERVYISVIDEDIEDLSSRIKNRSVEMHYFNQI